jgi:hypothetical protein
MMCRGCCSRANFSGLFERLREVPEAGMGFVMHACLLKQDAKRYEHKIRKGDRPRYDTKWIVLCGDVVWCVTTHVQTLTSWYAHVHSR